MGFVQRLTDKYDSFQRRYPLHAALLISPLVLLVDKKLMSGCLDQLKLVTVSECLTFSYLLILISSQASKALGNQRPKVLVDIELRFWNALLSIAFGKASAYSAVQDFISSVPWDKVAGVTQIEKDFFKPGAGPLCNRLTSSNDLDASQMWGNPFQRSLF
jgi:hypothetical protein